MAAGDPPTMPPAGGGNPGVGADADDFDAPDDFDTPPRWGWGRWLFSIAVSLILLLLAATPAALWWLGETASGRAFLASQLGRFTTESGLRFEVERLDGSLFSSFDVVNLRVHDLDGRLATVPLAEISWHPAALLRRKIDIERLEVPQARLLRRPHTNPPNPDEPLLPDIDIRIGRLTVGGLELAEAVAGKASVLVVGASVDIHSGRLLVDGSVESAQHDHLQLLVDAEPDGDRFALEARLDAPADGLLMPLAGVARPLRLNASGKGSWRRWRGALDARLGSGDAARPLAVLALSGDAGRFRLSGEVQPAPLLPAGMRPYLAPGVKLDIATDDDRGNGVPVRFVATTEALSMTGHATIDNARGRIDDGQIDLLVRKAGAANPQLGSDDLRAQVRLAGALRAPAIGWQLRARELGYGTGADRLAVRGLQATGDVRLATDQQPLQAQFAITAGQLLGLPADVAALVQQPRLTGTIAPVGGGIQLGKLALSTTALTATADAVAAADGSLRGKAQLALKRYAMAGVGAASASAQADFRRSKAGEIEVNADFRGQTLQLEAAGLRDFLGGLPNVAGKLRYQQGRPIVLTGLDFRSPALNVVGASGRYDLANGQLAFDAAGRSRDYGPFTLAARGTVATLQATLKAPSPGLGVGMTNLVVQVVPGAGGWTVAADAASNQGPLLARAQIRPADAGAGTPLSIDIARLDALGLSAHGRLAQTAEGPFAGQLRLGGRGIDGTFNLGTSAGIQQIVGALQLRNARLPLAVPVGVASGDLSFRAALAKDAPQFAGRWQLRGVTRETLVLARADGSADFHGGNGKAGLTFAGHMADGLPFDARLAVQSIADGYGIGFAGKIGDKPVRLQRPARLLRRKDGWELPPVRLLLPKGAVQLAGATGARTELQLVFADVDLSILDLLQGDMGFGGRVNGQLRLALDDRMKLPAATLDVKVAGLQRASITGLTAPVDLAVGGTSGNAGLQLGARISWQNNELGRLVARVAPGAGASVGDRLLGGALAGGIRYNGPVEPLWALVGSEGQALTGAVAVGADFAGTVGEPVLNGQTRGRGLVYRNAMFGTEIRAIAFDGRFSGAQLDLGNFSATANGGSIKGQGVVRFGANPSVDFRATLDKARVANSDTIGLTLSGPLRLRGRGIRGQLSGDLTVDDARYQVVPMSQAEVPDLKVRRQGVFVAAPAQGLSAESVRFDVRVRADDRIRVEGMGLDSMWRADLRLRGTGVNPQLTGSATLARGEFSFAGSDFNITSGRIVFNGAPLESAIDLRAETQAQDVMAIVTVAGTAGRPEVHFSSTPALPEDEILARLLFGSSVADLSVTEAVQLATAVAGLRSGTDTLGKIRRSVGLDRLRLVGNDSKTGMGSGLAVGKKLSRNLYAELLTDSEGKTLTTLQLTLSRIWSVFLDVSSVGASSVNLRYQREN